MMKPGTLRLRPGRPGSGDRLDPGIDLGLNPIDVVRARSSLAGLDREEKRKRPAKHTPAVDHDPSPEKNR